MVEKAVLTMIGKYKNEIIPKQFQLIVLDGITQIGRKAKSEEASVIFNIKDGGVSRQHAMIYPAGDDIWMIKDLGSTNGTYVNRNKLQSEPVKLNKGDVINIGQEISFQFEKTLINPNHALLCYPDLNPDGTINNEGLEIVRNFKDEILPHGFQGNIGELVDETRNKGSLHSWFDMLRRYATSESVSLIYIVGHGVDEEHLGLHRDGKDTVKWGLTIPYTQLFFWMSSIRGKKLLILDQCIPISEYEEITSRTTIIMNPFVKNGDDSSRAMGTFLRNLPDKLIGNDFFRTPEKSTSDCSHDFGENIIIKHKDEGYLNTPVIEFALHNKTFDIPEFSSTIKLDLSSL